MIFDEKSVGMCLFCAIALAVDEKLSVSTQLYQIGLGGKYFQIKGHVVSRNLSSEIYRGLPSKNTGSPSVKKTSRFNSLILD